MRGKYVDRVAAHAKRAANEIGLDAAVLQRDEIGDQLPLFELLAQRDAEGHRGVGLDRADAVNTRHRGDDDDVVAFSSARVAAWRIRSICSFTEDSFSI